MNEGWTCPVCRRGVAPTQKTCDHGGQAAMPNINDVLRWPQQFPWKTYTVRPYESTGGTIYMTDTGDIYRYHPKEGWGGAPGMGTC